MSTVYNIAFMGKPKSSFLSALRQLPKDDGVEIEALTVTEGPGCYNLGVMLESDNEKFINALTMALMPARWSLTSECDPAIRRGAFIDHVNRSAET